MTHLVTSHHETVGLTADIAASALPTWEDVGWTPIKTTPDKTGKTTAVKAEKE